MIGDAITFQKQLPPCGSLDIARFSARSDTRNWHRAVSKIFGGKKALRHVRFTPKSGHWNSTVKCLLCAKSGHYALQQIPAYSITSSAPEVTEVSYTEPTQLGRCNFRDVRRLFRQSRNLVVKPA